MKYSMTPSSETSSSSQNSTFSRRPFSSRSSTSTFSDKFSANRRRDDCNCGQETKVVVLIGPTQNGKSSLIKSILEYAGDHEQAATIHIGDGNRSATKEVSLYRIQVELGCHFLRDVDHGTQVDPSDAARNNTDPDSVETYEQPSGKHLHLLLIDTPGLDDSDQQPTNAFKTPSNSNSINLSRDNAVDTEHKLKVLQAMSVHPSIHSICFVLSRQRTLGGTTQRLGREYLEILQHCNLKPSVHFAHTYVNRDNMFDSGLANRPKELDGIFNHKFKHHIINNDPADDDPIEQCLAFQSLSNLLNGFLDSTSHACKNFGFPKPRELTSNEDQLKVALRALVSTAESNKKTFQSQKANCVAAKKQLEIHLKKLNEESSDLEDQIGGLDTDDLVTIVDETDYEPRHFSTHARIRYRRETGVVIRKSKVTSGAYTSWRVISPTVGTTSCCVDAEASMWEAARIDVKLWAYKKDKFEKRLKSLREELSQTKKSIKSFEQRIKDAEKEIREVSTKVKEYEDRICEIRKDQSIMEEGIPGSSSISLKMALRHHHLLTGSDTFRIAKVYGLRIAISRDELPGLSRDLDMLSENFRRLKGNFSSSMLSCAKISTAFTREETKYLSLLTQVRNADIEQRRLQGFLEKETEIPTTIPPSPHFTDPSQYPFEFEPLWETLQQRHGVATTQLEKLDEVKQSRIHGQPIFMKQLIKDVEGLSKSSETFAVKWNRLRKRYVGMEAAIGSVESNLGKRQIPIGVFTLIKRGWVGDTYDADAAFGEIFDLGRYPLEED